MGLWLINAIGQLFDLTVPTVFTYTSTRMVLATVTSLCTTIFLGPWFIRKLYELRIGQPIRKEECPMLAKLHGKKEDTPTMGGILILSCILFSLFLWMDLTHSFTLILLASVVVLGGLGAYDDWLKLHHRSSKGLAGRKKLLIQVGFAGLLSVYLLSPAVYNGLESNLGIQAPYARDTVLWTEAMAGVDEAEAPPLLSSQDYVSRIYIPFLKYPVWVASGWGFLLLGVFILFVITGSSNAVNLTDGLDGLAAGCVLMVAATLGCFAFVSNHIGIADYLHILYIDGSGEIAIFLSALVGACLGFLWYNGHPAQVFMGDTGSLGLGGAIGVAAVLLRREFLLGLAGGIFVLEALSVILQVASFRLRDGKRIFLCAPIHHHFEYKGWPETKVVLRFWIISLLLAVLALASLKFQ